MGGAACTGLAFCCMHDPAKMKNMCTCTKNKKKTHHTFSWIFECRHPLKQHCSTKSIFQTTLEHVLASCCTESALVQKLREKSCCNLKKDTEDSHVSNTRLIRAVFKWLLKVITWSINDNQNQNQWHHVRVISPAPRASYRKLLGIVIGSSRCLLLLWLVGVIISLIWFFDSHLKTSQNETIIIVLHQMPSWNGH